MRTNAFTPDELDEGARSVADDAHVLCISELAKAFHQETNGKSNLEQLAQSMMEIFPEAMGEYAHLGRSIYQARLETVISIKSPHATPKSDAMILVLVAAARSSRSAAAPRKERVRARSFTDRPGVDGARCLRLPDRHGGKCIYLVMPDRPNSITSFSADTSRTFYEGHRSLALFIS